VAAERRKETEEKRKKSEICLKRKGVFIMSNRQFCFDYNGKRYSAGTIVKINGNRGKKGKDIFECYIPEKKWYKLYYSGWYPEDSFYSTVTEITNEVDEKYLENKKAAILETKLTFSKEINIDGLGLAWLWYAFLMAISFIFNGFLIYWAVWTCLFFIYRICKLAQYGYRRISGSWYKLW
jgi:hypothetical protein